jgi:4a-hydroxytetrahydrobiopterin dehydratase
MSLQSKNCIPCSGDIPPMELDQALEMLKEIHPAWELDEEKMQLWRTLKFKDFKTPLELTNKIGALAQEQWHHPEITLGFGHLEIGIWTHKINGLVESDFIFAAKVDELLKDSYDSI